MFRILCLLVITFLVAVHSYSSESSENSSSGTVGSRSWHRRSRHYRSSSSEGDYDHHYGRLCPNIRKECDDEEHCAHPTIVYYEEDGKKKASVSCPNTKLAYLTTSDGEVLMKGMNGDKIVYCGEDERWFSKEINGDNVDFKTLRCIVLKNEDDNTDEED